MTLATSTQTARILVIDDMEQNRLLAEAILEASGYEVKLADSAETGLALFQETPYDLILLDIRMPGMDGFEACRALRALPGGADVTIVFLTAMGEFGAHHRSVDVGADDFLAKPINRTELLLRVRSLLRLKAFRDEWINHMATIRTHQEQLRQSERQRQELTDFLLVDLNHHLSDLLAQARQVAGTPHLPAPAQGAAHRVLAAGESMHVMVQHMLNAGHSRDGGLKAAVMPCDLGPIVTDIVRAISPRSERKRQDLAVSCGVALPPVQADPHLFGSVLTTLLDFAVRATPSGGTVTVDTQLTDDHHVEIRITDEGANIPAVVHQHIFERPAPLSECAEPMLKTGRSLSLIFCRLAMTAQGGQIRVEDRQPQGCSFCLRLPLAS